jgi:hypothetical protein
MSWLIAGGVGFGTGLLVFFLLPIIGMLAGWGWPATLMFTLGKTTVHRLALVVSESNDIVPKAMQYSPLGVELITLDGETKQFEDPAGRLHNWLGIRFALADEQSGTLFDPRDAALGMAKRRYDERSEAQFEATNDEWDQTGVKKWVPAAFSMPDRHQVVDLSAAGELVDGGERSEYPKRVKSLFEHAMAALEDGKGVSELMRMALPVFAMVGTFGAVWLLADQLGTSSASGSVVAFGSSLLVLAGTRRLRMSDMLGSDDSNGADGDPLAHEPGAEIETGSAGGSSDPEPQGSGGDDGSPIPDIDREQAKIIGGVLAAVGALAGFVGGLFLAFGGLGAAVGVAGLVAGLLALPVLAQTGRIMPALGTSFMSLFFKLGFLSYRRPVFVWTPERYEVREYDDLGETAGEPTWYGLFGQTVGFSFEPGAENFGEAGVSNDKLRSYTPEAVADGGSSASNVPTWYEKTPELGPDGAGGFIPSSLDGYGVLTDISLGWWRNSADGSKSMQQLLQAKEEFGGDGHNIADTTLMYLTFAGAIVGGVPAVVLFIL